MPKKRSDSTSSPIWDSTDPASPAALADGRRESPRANQVFRDYLRLGPGRTLQALLQSYLSLETPPARLHGTLRNWSSRFDWPARAAAWDALEEERLQAETHARRQAMLDRGLALEYERIERLTAFFEKLCAISEDDDSYWIKNVRILRYPDNTFERIETRRFNSALMRTLRGLLDDIASESGGRPLRRILPFDPAGKHKPALNPDDYSYDVFTREEKNIFGRLQRKLFHLEK